MSKIIATIGPRTETKESIKELNALGVKIFRLNLSHNSIEWHIKVINNIRDVSPSSSILADIPGRKIRTTFNISKEKFKKDQKIYLVAKNFTERVHKSNYIYEVNNNILFNMTKKGMTIYADDGRLSFEVENVHNKIIQLKAKCDGLLKECKGINIPESSFGKVELTQKDKYFLDFCCHHQIDFVGISFVDKADYMRQIQTYIGERPMQPTFGSKLLELCFEQQNDELPENIEKEVRRAVSEWLDYINIQNVETLTEEGDLNQIYVKIDYSTTLNPNTINQITIDASTGGY